MSRGQATWIYHPTARICRTMTLLNSLDGIKLRSFLERNSISSTLPYSRDHPTMADKETTPHPTAMAISSSTTSPAARHVRTSSPPPADAPAAPTITTEPLPEYDDQLEAVFFFLMHSLLNSNQCHRKTSPILVSIVPVSDRMLTSLYSQDNAN